MLDWRRGWGQSAFGICAFFYMSKLFGVVVLLRSILRLEEKVEAVCHGYMCILLYVKLIWCSGLSDF